MTTETEMDRIEAVARLLNSFCTKDERPENIRKPFKYEGRLVATDGHVMLLLDEQMEEAQGFDNVNGLNVNGVLPARTPRRSISVESIAAAYASLPREEIMEDGLGDCPECWGTGSSDCFECGQTRTCSDCDGGGKVVLPTVHTGLFRAKEDSMLGIDNAFFFPRVVERLLIAAETFDAQTIYLISASESLKAHLFRIREGVEVLVMPCANCEDHVVKEQLYTSPEPVKA